MNLQNVINVELLKLNNLRVLFCPCRWRHLTERNAWRKGGVHRELSFGTGLLNASVVNFYLVTLV